MIASIIKILAGVAIGVFIVLWFFQEHLIFFPRSLASRPVRPGVAEVVVVAPDGSKLRGWFLRGEGARAPLVIYFGGNAEEVSWLSEAADRFAGWSLLLLNYRGYGESEGRPSEEALLADSLAIHEFAKALPDVDPERIVAMGRSLGSGVAVHLAAERALRGVILVSPYDSLVAVAAHHYPFLPVSLMLRHRFDSFSRAPRIDAPLLCLVAADDRVVPVSHSRTLFQAWRGRKTWREIPRADHDSIAGEPEYWSAIADFLKAIR